MGYTRIRHTGMSMAQTRRGRLPGTLVMGPSLLNGGFETAGAGLPADALANWAETIPALCSIEQSADVPPGSPGVASMVTVVSAANGLVYVAQNGTLVVGARYLWTFWAKADAACTYRLELGSTTAATYTLTTTWTQYQGTGTCGATTQFAILRTSAAGRTIYVDDLWLWRL